MARRRPLAAAAALALSATAPARALAADFEVDVDTVGQAYQILDASGTLVNRRRLDQYVGLDAWNLGPSSPNGLPTPNNQVYFSASLRLETDLGDGAGSPSSWPVPAPHGMQLWGGRDVSQELRTDRADFLYAFVGVRDLLGVADLRLGRQIAIDQFQFESFDGLSVDVRTRFHVAAEAWGGLLVNGYLPIDSPLFRPDGTALSATSPHDADLKPLVGVALRATGFRDLDARLSYERIFSPAQHTTDAERAVRATDGTTAERITGSVRYRLFDGRLIPWAAARYDLLNDQFDIVQAGARAILTPSHSLTVEYVYSYPTFDGDSIWNLFARSRFDDVRAGWDGRFGALRLSARGFLRLFHDVTDSADRVSPTMYGAPQSPSEASGVDGGGTLGARYDIPQRGSLRLDGYVELGYAGTRIGADGSTRLRVWRDTLSLEGRLTWVHFVDDLRPDDGGESFGVQLGARIDLARGILVHLLVEDNVNRYYASQFRVYAMLDLAVLVASRTGFHGAPVVGPGPSVGGFGSGYGSGRGY